MQCAAPDGSLMEPARLNRRLREPTGQLPSWPRLVIARALLSAASLWPTICRQATPVLRPSAINSRFAMLAQFPSGRIDILAGAHISLSIYLATLCLPYLVWAAKICENFNTQRRVRRIAEHQNSLCTLFIGRSRSASKLADPLTPRERERPDQMPPRGLFRVLASETGVGRPHARLARRSPAHCSPGRSNRLSRLPESESRNAGSSAWKWDGSARISKSVLMRPKLAPIRSTSSSDSNLTGAESDRAGSNSTSC